MRKKLLVTLRKHLVALLAACAAAAGYGVLAWAGVEGEVLRAMPPLLAAIATMAISAGAIAGVTLSTAVFAGLTVGNLIFATTMVYGAVQQRKAEKRARANYNSALSDRYAPVMSASEAPWQIVYGEAPVGACQVAAMLTSGDRDQYKYVVYVWAAHECEAITDTLINGLSVGALDGNGDVQPGSKWFKGNGTPYTDTRTPNGSGQVTVSRTVSSVVSVTLTTGSGDGQESLTMGAGNISFSGTTITVNPAALTGPWAGAALQFTYTASGDGQAMLRVRHHLGSATQAADAMLLAECPTEWSSTDQLKGLCYSVFRYCLDETEFQGGPPQATVKIKGKKLYDARTGSTAWSANAALAVQDFLRSEYGKAAADNQLDWFTVNAAANVCDETLASQGGAKRYTCNGSFRTDGDPDSTLAALAQAMAGFATFDGTWSMQAGAYTTPVMDIADADNAGPVEVIADQAGDDVFNGLRGRFFDPARFDQLTDYTPYANAAYATADGGPIWGDLELPYTNAHWRAQNLARIQVERSRGMQLVFPGKLRLLKLRPGQRVRLWNSVLGISGAVFRVVKRDFKLGQPVMVTLQQDAASYYDEADATAPLSSPAVDQPDPFVVAFPTGVVCNSGDAYTLRATDGSVISRTRLTVNASTDSLVTSNGALQIEYRLVEDATFTRHPEAAGNSTQVHLLGLLDNRAYAGRVRWRNGLGAYSAWIGFGVKTQGTTTQLSWGAIDGKPPDSELVNMQGPYAVAQAWNFNGSTEGWLADFATLTAGALSVQLASTGTDPRLTSPAISIGGAGFYQVRMRVKRLAGSGWEGTIFYATSGHGLSSSYRKTVPDTTVTGEWVVMEWDMLNLTVGGTDWISSTITQLRVDLGTTASDVFEIDWIGIGTSGPASYGAEWGKNVIGSAAVDAAISAAQSTANTAQSTATAANSAAAAAQIAANNANTAITNIVSDNVLSRGEKSDVILQWTAIQQEQAGIDAQAAAYSVGNPRTNYNNAVSALSSYLSGLSPAWDDTAQDTPISGTAFRATFATVYAKRQELLDEIAGLARSLANAAQNTANTASTNATAAQSLLATMRSNGYIDAAEKPALMREWNYIVGEYSPLTAQAAAYNITTEKTSYDDAYTALSVYLASLSPSWTDTSTDTPVTPAVDQAKWNDYYYHRGRVTQRIAEEAGKRSIWASTTGRPTNLASLVGTESLLNNEASIIRAPAGGVFVSTAATQTGALRIRLPQPFTDTMMRFIVDIYEYGAGLSCSLEIAGFANSSVLWQNVTARVVGDANVEYPVRFGHDSIRCCVWIGNAGDTWAFPQVRVRDWFGGYSNYAASQWESGWSIAFDTAGAINVSATVLDTLPGADLTKGKGAVSTAQIAAGAATAISIDDHDFAGTSFGTTTARTWTVTPAVDCWIEFSARVEAATIDGDSGKTVGWWVVPGGGSAVALGGSSTPGTAKKEVVCINAFSATGGVALQFEIRTSNGGSAPNPVLYKSIMRVTQIKR